MSDLRQGVSEQTHEVLGRLDAVLAERPRALLDHLLGDAAGLMVGAQLFASASDRRAALVDGCARSLAALHMLDAAAASTTA